MERIKLSYPKNLLAGWKSGNLQEEWARQYPKAFDKNDLHLALSQRRYHFGEWFVAVHFAQMGYRVLVEKYLYKNHPKKLKAANLLLPDDKVALLKALRPRHQFPDLLVYNNRESFFAEVKKDSDTLRESQAKFFKRVEKTLMTKVILVSLKSI